MTAPLVERLSVADLEEMFDRILPCEGVVHLDIPPCGEAAEWVLDYAHECLGKPASPAQYKCTKCHNRFMACLERILAVHGDIECNWCHIRLPSVADWVHYRKI